jgi:hypothetical protein
VEERLMSDWEELYPASTSVTTPTTAPMPSVVDVVDLRVEFDNLVLGYQGETPVGRKFILRRMRRDSSDALIPCSCVDELTKEPSRDYPCPYCLGNGFLWDEELVVAYKVVAAAPGGSNAAANFPKSEPGTMSIPAARFFLSYSVAPRRSDRIVEIELDSDGEPVTPYNRTTIYELMLVRDMRADNGKIEFWVCNGQKMGPETQGWVG